MEGAGQARVVLRNLCVVLALFAGASRGGQEGARGQGGVQGLRFRGVGGGAWVQGEQVV